MAAGTLTQGERMPDAGFKVWELQPGQYGRVQREDEGWVFYGCTPLGQIGDLSAHEVTEHEDGTITVSPSILAHGGAHAAPERGDCEWHGYLERGVWREV